MWSTLSALDSRWESTGPEHSGDSLLAHLFGTHELLRAWGTPADVCLAGLCHSVYSTTDSPYPLFSNAERSSLSNLTGEKAENLARAYAVLNKADLRANVASSCSLSDFETELLAIDVANEVEQIGRLGATPQIREYLRRATQRLDMLMATHVASGIVPSLLRGAFVWVTRLHNATGPGRFFSGFEGRGGVLVALRSPFRSPKPHGIINRTANA